MSRVHHYSNSTGTGTLRAHLLNNHPDEWVSKCQSLNIVLKGKEGEEALAKFTGLPLQHQAKARVPFSQEAFLDGLVDFTVATNQVFFFFFFFCANLMRLFFSLLELWTEKSFDTSVFCSVLSCGMWIFHIGPLCISVLSRHLRRCLLIWL